MKRTQLMLIGFLALSAMITGCTKDPLNHLNAEESRIYVTSFDSSVNFSSYKTYSIADSVGVIDNGSAIKERTELDQAYIDAVNKYMQQRGYMPVNKNSNPDLAVNINRVYHTSTGLIDYTDYWDYYDGYWDPSYWGYSGDVYYVPYVYGAYQVTEGLMSVDMFDLKNAVAHGNKINLVWNGLVRGEGIFDSANADPSVKALFDQSPYLTANE